MQNAFKVGKGMFAKGLALAKHLKEMKAAAATAAEVNYREMTPDELYAEMGVDQDEVEATVSEEVNALPEAILAQFDDTPIEFWAEIQDFTPEVWEAMAEMEGGERKWKALALSLQAAVKKAIADLTPATA